MDIEDFDWNFYIENNLDLKENNINTKESAINHWINFGQYEDRISKFKNSLDNKENSDNRFSSLCENICKLKNLQENNSITKEDAWNLLLNTYDKMEKDSNIISKVFDIKDNILEDFVTITIENFDWNFYLSNNNDLVKNGINNKVLSWDHWIIFGKNENRDFKLLMDKLTTPVNDLNNCVIVNEDNFDWKFYLKSNNDLVENNIITKERAWHHWLTIGKTEDRILRIINNKLTIENSTNSDLPSTKDEQKTILSNKDSITNFIDDLIDFDVIYHKIDNEYTLPEINEIIHDVYKSNNIQNKTPSIIQENSTSNIIEKDSIIVKEKFSTIVNNETSEKEISIIEDPFSDIVNDEVPALLEEKKSTVVENKDSTVVEKDSTIVENKVPTVVEKKDSTVVEKKVPTVVEKDSTVVEKKVPTVVEKDSTVVENKVPTVVKKDSTVVEKKVPTVVEKDSTVVEKKVPTVVENKVPTVEKKVPTVVENKVPTVVKKDSTVVEKDSTVVENKDSTVVEKDSTVVEKDSTVVENKDSTVVEKDSTVADNKLPTIVDNISTENKSIELSDNSFVKIKFDKEFILSLSDKKNYNLKNPNESI
jgi:hypothetical protein